MSLRPLLLVALLAAACAPGARADELAAAASWTAPTAAEVRAKLEALFAERLPLDERARLKFEALWPPVAAEGAAPRDGAAMLDDAAAALALADPRIEALVRHCLANAPGPPPVEILAEPDLPPLVADNLKLLLARTLAGAEYYDEALALIDGLTTEHVVDPATLLFHQAVGRHRLLQKEACLAALSRLLENESQLPRRYAVLARLMEADLAPLKTDSLDEVARIMENVERRLDFGRAGQRVRTEEEQIVAKLDKLIEELEKQQQGGGGGGGGQGGNSNQPSAPMQDSGLANNRGPGDVDPKSAGQAGDWGDLPPKARQEALQELSKDLPAHYREVIEEYFRKIARDGSE